MPTPKEFMPNTPSPLPASNPSEFVYDYFGINNMGPHLKAHQQQVQASRAHKRVAVLLGQLPPSHLEQYLQAQARQKKLGR